MNNESQGKPSTGGILRKSNARKSRESKGNVSWGQFSMRLVGTNTEYHEEIESCEPSEGDSSNLIKTAGLLDKS